MRGWLFFIGAVFIYLAVAARLQRREHRSAELVELGRAKRTAYFWGYDVEAANQAFSDKVIEHDSWRHNIKFELKNWAGFAVGIILLLSSAVFWMGEDPSHTLDLLRKNVWDGSLYLIGGAFVLYYVYQLVKQLDKADNEITWLNATLEELKKYADRKFSEQNYRLDTLENEQGR